MDTEGMDEEEARALAEALRLSMGETGDASADMQVDAPPAPPAAALAADVAAVAVEPSPTTPVEIGNGLPLGFTGQYELHAIVTHKGRSADSGHYMGWVRQAPGSQLWWCYNDDKVTETNTEAVSSSFCFERQSICRRYGRVFTHQLCTLAAAVY
jgi:ubiquitin carboxyl-terminal hydrolase 14